MTPAPPGSEPCGFVYGPELWMLGLGVIATAVVVGVFFWLIRLMIREDREVHQREAMEDRAKKSGQEAREE